MTNDSSSSRDLLAKSQPPVSLAAHSETVGNVTKQLLDTPVVSRRLEANGLDIGSGQLRDLGEFTGRLHDAGKAHLEWQDACHAASNGDTQGRPSFPPHSTRSALYAFAAARERGLPQLQGLAATLAILHHHTPMTAERMTGDQLREPVDDLDGLSNMCHSFSTIDFPHVDIDAGIRDSFVYAVSDCQSKTPRANDYRPLGVLVTLLRTALIQADHYASASAAGGNAPLPDGLNSSDLSLFNTLRPFQTQVEAVDDDRLIGLAGCGEGKTHTALQWGGRMVEDNKANRLVFAMPTQVTTNNLLLSMTGGPSGEHSGHIPNKKAALYHSASETFYEGDVASERWDISDARLDERARRWFQRPVTVTTVDQVLSTLVNGYDWATVARGNLLQSAVIFDELHAYDRHTTGHILGAISALNRAGIPWYVMSATIPPQIRQHRSVAGATNIESDGRINASLPPREPFTVQVENKHLNADVVRSRAEESDARRIMVVRNTVAEARELARVLRDAGEEVIYYSSAFTKEDRERKEAEIRERFGSEYSDSETRAFLVATQVCEISLDLSADLLLTDIAPVDAIIQRAGRLHRSGIAPDVRACHEDRGADCSQCVVLPAEHEYEAIVYAPLDDVDQWLPYAADTSSIEWKILERTADVLSDASQYSFSRSLEWVKSVYDGLNIEFDASRMIRASRDDWLYGEKRRVAPDADGGDDRLEIRDISSYKRPMLMREYTEPDGSVWTPSERWQQVHDCPRDGQCGIHVDTVTSCDHELWRFASQYSVEIPQWWLRSNNHSVGVSSCLSDADGQIESVQIATVDYTYMLGADPHSGG